MDLKLSRVLLIIAMALFVIGNLMWMTSLYYQIQYNKAKYEQLNKSK